MHCARRAYLRRNELCQVIIYSMISHSAFVSTTHKQSVGCYPLEGVTRCGPPPPPPSDATAHKQSVVILTVRLHSLLNPWHNPSLLG